MYRLTDALRAALRSGQPAMVVRLVSLWPDGSVRQAYDLRRQVVVRGVARADRASAVRRVATLTLSNADGSLSPAIATDVLAEGAPMRLELGALVDGVPLLVPMVTGFVGPGTSVAMRGATVDVTIESRLSACRQEAGEAMQLAAGTPLPSALRTLWGPVLPHAGWLVAGGAADRTLGSDVPVLPTDDRLEVGARLARDLGCEAFDDREGAIVVRPRPDPSAQPVDRAMSSPIDLSRGVVRPPINAQAVEVAPGADAPAWVVEEVDDPASPVHRSRIGLRMGPAIRSDAIADPGTARLAARARLAGVAADRVTATEAIEHLDLDPGDVVERDEPVTRTAGRFVIESIEVPIGGGAITTVESSAIPLFLGDLG